jgi:cobalt-zinc-cadmium efflux system membrane fusion protein
MNRTILLKAILSLGLSLLIAGCERRVTANASTVAGTGPTLGAVEAELDANNFKVAHQERFSVAIVGEHVATSELNVTGVVSPDVSRQVPVPSLASGRVVEIDARLGDRVTKGQLLYKVRSTDIAGAFSDYRKAVRNEELARIQLKRANLLFENGAIPKSTLEVAQTTEDNAKIDLDTATEHLHLLGADLGHPSGIVGIYAPVSGVITDQQITDSSGVQALTAPNPFTISDLSHVWIVCDVYENDMAQVHQGEYADIRLNAYPDRVLKARISNILPVLDPNIRTTKVRLEMENPGLLRLGMFVTAAFHGLQQEKRAVVPATAILHLHDREWVYTPTDTGTFRRLEVVAGDVLPGSRQEIVRGIQPGAQVVANALVFQNAVEQ